MILTKEPESFLAAHPEVLATPVRLVSPFSWVGHIPFAIHVMNLLRPRVFVELGVHTGNSFFAFCQGALLAKLPASCFGVDTWRGDEHAGFYEQKVYDELLREIQRSLPQRTHLLRMLFDEALSTFSDGSIDLLHIDGLHTYEAVKHDFETWLPKMSERGVVLFHDTFVRSDDFGVWRLFEEIKSSYPAAEFTHSYGLGVAVVGDKPQQEALDLVRGIEAKDERAQQLQRIGELLTATVVPPEQGLNELRAHIVSLEERIAQLQVSMNEKDKFFHEVVTGKDELFRTLEIHSQARLRQKEQEITLLREELAKLQNEGTGAKVVGRKWSQHE